jgi:sepiapterin reductase
MTLDMPDRRVRVVNISSLLAIRASKYYGLYCTGKAARDMFHQIIAREYVGDC